MNLSDLSRDNARLRELESAYAALDLPFKHSLWQKHQNEGVNIQHFRADGAYLGTGALRDDQYRIMYDYVVSIDERHYLDRLTEDREFGIEVYEFDGKIVSRDLLDSILELYFVKEALPLLYDKRPLRWLDVGAGYGRFSHRLNALSPETNYITCVDAISVSSFLCEFYTQYRGCTDHVEVLPLTRLDEIEPGDFDIACNIHSFSEMSQAAISFWLENLVKWEVPYFFLQPHDPRFVSVEPDGTIGNFAPLLAKYGYECIYSRSKYPEGVNGLYPEVVHYMYKRNA